MLRRRPSSLDGPSGTTSRSSIFQRTMCMMGTVIRAGENGVRASGCCFLIVRTCWVYAAQGKNFLRTVARLAQERKELRIVADQIGAPTSAALIAGSIVAILKRR